VVKNELFAGLYSEGLYRWRAMDGVWRKSGDVRPLALASAGGTLIAGHNPGGVFWSDDLGETWHRSGSSEGFGAALLEAAERSDDPVGDAPVWEMHSEGSIVLAGAGDGIFISRDFGRSWQRAINGLPRPGAGISFGSSGDSIVAGIAAPQ
jgi:hypothetical protein